jgi:hypothetical protein
MRNAPSHLQLGCLYDRLAAAGQGLQLIEAAAAKAAPYACVWHSRRCKASHVQTLLTTVACQHGHWAGSLVTCNTCMC